MNFPKFLLRLSLSDTIALATDTSPIPSSLVLFYVKRAWCIWERSQVFTRPAVENVRSPVELVAGLTCTSLQILATWSIKPRSCTFKDFTSLKMSSKYSTSALHHLLHTRPTPLIFSKALKQLNVRQSYRSEMLQSDTIAQSQVRCDSLVPVSGSYHR